MALLLQKEMAAAAQIERRHESDVYCPDHEYRVAIATINPLRARIHLTTWLPDVYSQIFRLYEFGPLGLKDYGSATLRCKI